MYGQPFNPGQWDQYGAREIEGLPDGMGPGGVRPPSREEGMSNADYISQLIAFHTTPRNHQKMTKFDGGQTYGPSREATVRPDDMKTAEGLMDLLAALNAEEDLEQRRELAMNVMQPKPQGGGTIEMRGALGKPTRYGRAAPGMKGEETVGGAGSFARDNAIEADERGQGLTMQDALQMGGAPETKRKLDILQTGAENSGYGNRGPRARTNAQGLLIQEAMTELPQQLLMLKNENLGEEDLATLNMRINYYKQVLDEQGIPYDESGVADLSVLGNGEGEIIPHVLNR